MPRTKKSPKAATVSFRPDADVGQMLEVAERSLSDTTSALINECLRMALPFVLQAKVDSQTKALESLRESLKPAMFRDGKR